ncbi:MAG: hypothetical protein IPP31_11360 [Chitinophagaceae bacterium]|nr:hypothetical protein [Chitinophagaceae bacterium]
MPVQPTKRKEITRERIIFATSLLVSLFWYSGRNVNVYQFAALGAVYEMLWLPALALLVILPVIAIYYLVKEKFSFRSLYLYSLMVIGLCLVLTLR